MHRSHDGLKTLTTVGYTVSSEALISPKVLEIACQFFLVVVDVVVVVVFALILVALL